MTAAPPQSLSREELFELAAIDAIGQLDDYEQSLFTRSFHHAPASIQNEIIEFQAALVSDIKLLPSVEPPEQLKRKVSEAVSRAVEKDASRHAPLAMIGGLRTRQSESDPEGRARLAAASTTLWRAASFVLAASLIIAIYLFADAYQYGKGIAEKALDNNTNRQLESLIGPSFREFVGNPNSRMFALIDQSGQVDGHAALYLNEVSGQIFLLVMGMPESDDPYTLNVTTEDGRSIALHTFQMHGAIKGLRIDNVGTEILASTTWSITDSVGAVVLTVARS